ALLACLPRSAMGTYAGSSPSSRLRKAVRLRSSGRSSSTSRTREPASLSPTEASSTTAAPTPLSKVIRSEREQDKNRGQDSEGDAFHDVPLSRLVGNVRGPASCWIISCPAPESL